MDLFEMAVDFHGHACPGLAIGVRAVEAAIERLGIKSAIDEEIVCVAENDACGVDAIQAILSCTAGKGNLIFRLRGKQAFSFFNRNTGESIRVVLKPIDKDMSREERQEYILSSSLNELFEYTQPSFEIPEKARIFRSMICKKCGENTAENYIRIEDGETVCLDCFHNYGRGFD